jgi:hypothetical protein
VLIKVCLEGWISPPERAAERFVENCDAHVEEGLQGPSVPSHLLLLDHALRQDFVDRALYERGRDRQAVMPALPIVHQRATVCMQIFDQIDNMPSGGNCAAHVTDVNGVKPVRQFRQATEARA